jgi:hypothetical protein
MVLVDEFTPYHTLCERFYTRLDILDVVMLPRVAWGVLLVLDRGARVLLSAASFGSLGDCYGDFVFLDLRGIGMQMPLFCFLELKVKIT